MSCVADGFFRAVWVCVWFRKIEAGSVSVTGSNSALTLISAGHLAYAGKVIVSGTTTIAVGCHLTSNSSQATYSGAVSGGGSFTLRTVPVNDLFPYLAVIGSVASNGLLRLTTTGSLEIQSVLPSDAITNLAISGLFRVASDQLTIAGTLTLFGPPYRTVALADVAGVLNATNGLSVGSLRFAATGRWTAFGLLYVMSCVQTKPVFGCADN